MGSISPALSAIDHLEAFSEPKSGVIVQHRDTPAHLLAELSRERWSGTLAFELATGAVSLWLADGRVAWAEGVGLRRSLAVSLSRLLGVSQVTLRALAEDWLRRAQPFADTLLQQPGITEAKLRDALREHVAEALRGVTEGRICSLNTVPLTAAPRVGVGRPWSFALADVLSVPAVQGAPRESLSQLAARVRGASWVDVVTDGVAAGVGDETPTTRRLIEDADALLLGHADGVELALLHDGARSWAGWRPATSSIPASTWVGFDAEIGLGRAFMGLQAMRPWLDAERTSPVLPRLTNMPSVFPADGRRLQVRTPLTEALELGEGALGAHVLEGDTVRWRSLAHGASIAPAFLDAVTRAGTALEVLTQHAEAPSSGAIVLLDGGVGFHLGTLVPGTTRTFLFLTFVAGTSYGNSMAALSLGARALGESFARSRDSLR